MSRKNLDLMLLLLLVIINLGWTLVPEHPSVVDLIFALPLVFALPGYALTEALFKRSSEPITPSPQQARPRRERPFHGSDRFILSIGLSLSLDIVGGLLLNVLPAGLDALSWTALLSILTIVFSGIALYRRRDTPVNAQKGRGKPLRLRSTLYAGAMLGLAVTLATVSVWVSTLSEQQQASPDFTQFWILQAQQMSDNCAALVGIHSSEAVTTTYSVDVTVNGVRASAWSSIVLNPQGEWEQPISMGAEIDNSMYMEAHLYRSDQPGVVYRNVHLAMNRVQGGANQSGQQCSV